MWAWARAFDRGAMQAWIDQTQAASPNISDTVRRIIESYPVANMSPPDLSGSPVLAFDDHAVHLAVQPCLPRDTFACQVCRRRYADVAAEVGGAEADPVPLGGAHDRARGHALADAQVPPQQVPVSQAGPGGHDLLRLHRHVHAYGEPRPATVGDPHRRSER